MMRWFYRFPRYIDHPRHYTFLNPIDFVKCILKMFDSLVAHPCLSDPCQNYGTCTVHYNYGTFNCDCMYDSAGKLCEYGKCGHPHTLMIESSIEKMYNPTFNFWEDNYECIFVIFVCHTKDTVTDIPECYRILN